MEDYKFVCRYENERGNEEKTRRKRGDGANEITME